MLTRPRILTVAVALAMPLGLAACGGDDDTEASPTTETVIAATPLAQIADLEGVSTAIAVEQSFADALGSLRVATDVLGDASISGSTVSFPITDGRVTYFEPETGVRPFVQGRIEHRSSGLSFSASGSTIELRDFVVDPGESVLTSEVTVDGEVVADSARTFFLDGRTLEPLSVDEEQGTAALIGTTVSLHPDAAQLLRETFATQDIPDNLEVGTATITLALPGATPSPSPSESVSPSPSPSPSVSVSVSVSASVSASPSPSPVPTTPNQQPSPLESGLGPSNPVSPAAS